MTILFTPRLLNLGHLTCTKFRGLQSSSPDHTYQLRAGIHLEKRQSAALHARRRMLFDMQRHCECQIVQQARLRSQHGHYSKYISFTAEKYFWSLDWSAQSTGCAKFVFLQVRYLYTSHVSKYFVCRHRSDDIPY